MKNPFQMPSFRDTLEESLEQHFPKRKCKERSSALMLYATAILHHEYIMNQVRRHLSVLLSQNKPSAREHEEATAFYNEITRPKDQSL